MREDSLPLHATDGPEHDRLDRARGCLLGQLAGDALGSMVEFTSANEVRMQYPRGLSVIGPSPVHHTLAGQPTDDSEMALALARSVLASGGFDEEAVAGTYADWLASGPFDCGITIRRALAAMLEARAHGHALAPAGRTKANHASQANGALMRQSPLGIWGWQLAPDRLAQFVRADTTLTHPNQACQDASAAFIVALAAVIRDGLDGPAAYKVACTWDRRHGTSPGVTAALADAEHTLPAFAVNTGHVLIALQNAFYQALHAPTLERGIIDTVEQGGDSDTNAAIAGALLGAIHGLDAVPEQWRTTIRSCRPAKGISGCKHPRPSVYWPGDALEVAGLLIRAGTAADPETLAAQPDENGPSDGEATASTIPVRPRLHGAADLRRTSAAAPSDQERSPQSATVESGLRGRFRAALLGGAIGDALGRPAEGSRHPQYAPPWRITDYIPWSGYTAGPKGTITDDTQLTMLVAQTLLRQGRLEPGALAQRLVDWLPKGRGKGQATEAAVLRLKHGMPWYLAGEDSAGNGAAMRVAPIGLLRYRHQGLLQTEAELSALPTHRHPMAVAGAVAMATATAWLLRANPTEWSPKDFVEAIQTAIAGMEPEPVPERRDPARLIYLHDRIGELPALIGQPPERVLSYLYNGAFTLESVPAALYCFLRTPRNIEETLLLAVNAGYDADTVAAMAGTLGGALGGEAALPRRLLGELEYRELLIELADGLYHLATASTDPLATDRDPDLCEPTDGETEGGITGLERGGHHYDLRRKSHRAALQRNLPPPGAGCN